MSMKKLLVVALALVLFATPVALGGQVKAQDDFPTQRTITVTGYGVAYGAPDVVRVGLGVEAVNEDILTAVNDGSDRMNAVLQALQDAGVAAEDIRTEYYSIYQDYGYGTPMEGGEQPVPRYRVSTTVTVTVRDTDNVAELVSAAVAAGANIVNYVQFDISDRSALESEARNDAIADARSRADQIAATLGVTVGEPLRIVEGFNQYPMPEFFGGGGGAGAAGSVPPISQGQLSVSMAVTITYAVQ